MAMVGEGLTALRREARNAIVRCPKLRWKQKNRAAARVAKGNGVGPAAQRGKAQIAAIGAPSCARATLRIAEDLDDPNGRVAPRPFFK
jgi:hypothetical protein